MRHRSVLGLCLLAAACDPTAGGLFTTGVPSRLDVATVRTLDAVGSAECPAGVWLPLSISPTETAGTTRETWRAERCGATRQLNFLIAEVPQDGTLSVTALLPGTTRFTPAEQRAAAPAVLQNVPDRDCRSRWIVTTAAPDGSDGEERWTVDACGTQHRYAVHWDRTAEPVLVVKRLT